MVSILGFRVKTWNNSCLSLVGLALPAPGDQALQLVVSLVLVSARIGRNFSCRAHPLGMGFLRMLGPAHPDPCLLKWLYSWCGRTRVTVSLAGCAPSLPFYKQRTSWVGHFRAILLFLPLSFHEIGITISAAKSASHPFIIFLL